MKLSTVIAISLVLAALPLAANVAAHTCVGPVDACGPCDTPGYHDHTEIDVTTVPTTVTNCVNDPGNLFCPAQPTHTYGAGSSVGARSETADAGRGVGLVTVTDTNVADCNGDGVPGDWDGDLDSGTGGGAFGYGAWALDPDCDYDLNTHGPNVAVNDVVFGADIGFVVGEDDQSGPIKVQDPVDGSWTCTTDGSIRPCPNNNSTCPEDPTRDGDDCLSVRYVGTGATCGTGGGDGLYWVFLDGARVVEGTGEALGLQNNPPTSGTLTAF